MSRAWFHMLSSGIKGIFQEALPELKEGVTEAIKNGGDSREATVPRLGNHTVTEPFQYSPLPAKVTPQDQPFRLVALLPGGDGDDIECTLLDASLDKSVDRYEALSYVWGNTPPENPIQVNGATLRVGTSLWEALYHLRLPDSTRTLWIDAICINQGDNAEKVHQLPLMRDIYRNASQVVVWLGIGSPSYTEKAYTMVQDLAAAADDPEHECDPSRGYEDPFFRKMALDDSMHITFFQSVWYTRVWCTQEIVLAKRAVLVTGRYKVDWALFCEGIKYGEQLGAWNEVQFGIAPTSPAANHLATKALGSPPSFENPADELLFYLGRTRDRVATNPRDKIFGILGLLGGNVQDIGIQPSYESPVEAVYAEITTRLIAASRNLDVLGFCSSPRTTTKHHQPRLPRWVADWTRASHLLKPMMEDAKGNRRVTDASRGLRADPRWEDDGLTLVLEGHIVDAISRVSVRAFGQDTTYTFKDVSEQEDSEDSDATKEAESESEWWFWQTWNWIKGTCGAAWGGVEYVVLRNAVYVDWEAFVKDVEPTNPGTEGHDPMSVLCQTLCTGTLAPGGLAETTSMFEQWLETLAPIRTLKSWRVDRVGGVFALVGLVGYIRSTWNSFGEFTRYIYHAEDRRLGATAKGYLCLLPKTAQPGDRLVILKGGRFPVIVRPRDDGWVDFIGEAYVHGIMDGEVFDEKSCVEMKFR